MPTPIFCVNVPASAARKQKFAAQWVRDLGFSVQFWDAVDKTSPEIVAKMATKPYVRNPAGQYFRPMVPGELSLIATYIQILQHSVQHKYAGVIIMEDDVAPNFMLSLLKSTPADVLDTYVSSCIADYPALDLLLLHRPAPWNSYAVLREMPTCYVLDVPPWGAQMNFYTLRGMQKMLQNIQTGQVILDQYHRMPNFRSHICLAKIPFCVHADTRAKIPAVELTTDIGPRPF